MLKGISPLLNGDLLKVLCDMGHGDEIVIADANFPAHRCGRKVIELPCAGGVKIAEAILELMPLDHLEGAPAHLMSIAEGDCCGNPPIWKEYRAVVSTAAHGEEPIGYLDRNAFYNRAEEAFAVVHTGEKALYGNLILRKGVL